MQKDRSDQWRHRITASKNLATSKGPVAAQMQPQVQQHYTYTDNTYSHSMITRKRPVHNNSFIDTDNAWGPGAAACSSTNNYYATGAPMNNRPNGGPTRHTEGRHADR